MRGGGSIHSYDDGDEETIFLSHLDESEEEMTCEDHSGVTG